MLRPTMRLARGFERHDGVVGPTLRHGNPAEQIERVRARRCDQEQARGPPGRNGVAASLLGICQVHADGGIPGAAKLELADLHGAHPRLFSDRLDAIAVGLDEHVVRRPRDQGHGRPDDHQARETAPCRPGPMGALEWRDQLAIGSFHAASTVDHPMRGGATLRSQATDRRDLSLIAASTWRRRRDAELEYADFADRDP
ncbi:MAG: hypothetical protein H7138_10800 [Myxococcales bacterium]|nr:hypothetical protein [Myxococcales bacterium]